MPGKLAPQNYQEMVKEGREKRSSSKLYKEASAEFVSEQLSSLINKAMTELTEIANAEPISLRDIAEVKRRSILYMEACADAACFPSVAGLARSMGLSRQSLYDTISRQSPKDTAKWLELCRDTFSDILAEASLKNNCNNITAIFLQKALYNMRESVEIVAKTENPLGEEVDLIELQKRIEGNVVIDEEEGDIA